MSSIGLTSKSIEVPEVIPRLILKFNGYSIRLAAFSGVLAIIIDSYYNESKYLNMIILCNNYNWYLLKFLVCYSKTHDERMSIYNVASQYHFLNALILIGLPLCRWPFMVICY
jgi:hypothetical protein